MDDVRRICGIDTSTVHRRKRTPRKLVVERDNKIVALYQSNPDTTHEQIAEIFGLKKTNANRIIGYLRKEGRI